MFFVAKDAKVIEYRSSLVCFLFRLVSKVKLKVDMLSSVHFILLFPGSPQAESTHDKSGLRCLQARSVKAAFLSWNQSSTPNVYIMANLGCFFCTLSCKAPSSTCTDRCCVFRFVLFCFRSRPSSHSTCHVLFSLSWKPHAQRVHVKLGPLVLLLVVLEPSKLTVDMSSLLRFVLICSGSP